MRTKRRCARKPDSLQLQYPGLLQRRQSVLRSATDPVRVAGV